MSLVLCVLSLPLSTECVSTQESKPAGHMDSLDPSQQGGSVTGDGINLVSLSNCVCVHLLSISL